MIRRVPNFLIHTMCSVPFVAALALIFYRLQPTNGEMGHDYYHYFVRLYLGSIHFWQNGLATPHFTPSLCGGMPFFADPQSIYHSLQQVLAFFVPPLLATHATFLIFYLLGYWGMWRLCHEVFDMDIVVSHLGALLFSLNGFTFAHIYFFFFAFFCNSSTLFLFDFI